MCEHSPTITRTCALSPTASTETHCRLHKNVQRAVLRCVDAMNTPFARVQWERSFPSIADKRSALSSQRSALTAYLRDSFAWKAKPSVDFLIAQTNAFREKERLILLTTFRSLQTHDELPQDAKKIVLEQLGYTNIGTDVSVDRLDRLVANRDGINLEELGLGYGFVGPWHNPPPDPKTVTRIIVPRYGDEERPDGVNWDGEVWVDYALANQESLLLPLHAAYRLPQQVGMFLGIPDPAYLHYP